MNETKLVNGFYSQDKFCHVEAGNVFCEDVVLDKHRHQISSWQEFHEHVQECRVLESRVQLDYPWTCLLYTSPSPRDS